MTGRVNIETIMLLVMVSIAFIPVAGLIYAVLN